MLRVCLHRQAGALLLFWPNGSSIHEVLTMHVCLHRHVSACGLLTPAKLVDMLYILATNLALHVFTENYVHFWAFQIGQHTM